jgi:hypothetical protein
MRKFILFLFFTLQSAYSQDLKKDLFSFQIDNQRNEYIVRVAELGFDKRDVTIKLVIYGIIVDYEGKKTEYSSFTATQKLNNDGNIFFGGELVDGRYVITLSYTVDGKKNLKP